MYVFLKVVRDFIVGVVDFLFYVRIEEIYLFDGGIMVCLIVFVVSG